jgi:hypothetical protein
MGADEPTTPESDARKIVLTVNEPLDPGPGQASSYVDELLVGFNHFRTRGSSWNDDPMVRERLPV